jgi:hypothetical protein
MTCSEDDLTELVTLLLKHAGDDQTATAREIVDAVTPLIARREAIAAARALWDPDFHPQVRAAVANDWWRGDLHGRLTCSQQVLERVGLRVGPDGQIIALEVPR